MGHIISDCGQKVKTPFCQLNNKCLINALCMTLSVSCKMFNSIWLPLCSFLNNHLTFQFKKKGFHVAILSFFFFFTKPIDFVKNTCILHHKMYSQRNDCKIYNPGWLNKFFFTQTNYRASLGDRE